MLLCYARGLRKEILIPNVIFNCFQHALSSCDDILMVLASSLCMTLTIMSSKLLKEIAFCFFFGAAITHESSQKYSL